MITPIADGTPRFQVVKNRAGRYTLLPSESEPPAGWHRVLASAPETDCLQYVRRMWPALCRDRWGQGKPTMRFGLMFFGGGEDPQSRDKYRLVLESSRFADEHGFASVWLPERHFAPFGCLYPNPAVLHAALARETKHLRLRAGSVVLPLHHPIRVAEDWAVVDNLSGGRVELSFAPGWNPDDFVLAPDKFKQRSEDMVAGLQVVQRLWKGETISSVNGRGETVAVRIYPTPIQPSLPTWLTAAGNPRTFQKAGELGTHVLTHLFDQSVEELAAKVRLYHEARAQHGHDPEAGQVCVALHTFVADSAEAVRDHAYLPYCDYLKANVNLLEGLAASRGVEVNLSRLSGDTLDEAVAFLFEKFVRGRSLLTTPEAGHDLVVQLAEAGVNEVACLLDFGVDVEVILNHLPALNRLRQLTEGHSWRNASEGSNRIAITAG